MLFSLLSRFADDEMPGEPLGLCGALKVDSKFIRADFGGKQVRHAQSSGLRWRQARVQIWDVMGAERQRCVDQYYQEADVRILLGPA